MILALLIIQLLLLQSSIALESEFYAVEERGEDIYLTPKAGGHKQTIIFLHGFQGSASGEWYPLFSENRVELAPPETKVILLNAPLLSITFLNGSLERAWFDIKSFDHSLTEPNQMLNVQQLKDSQQRINKVIEEEIQLLGGDSQRIVLIGYSQGVPMSLATGLGFNQPLGGIVGWCGDFINVVAENEANQEVPILLANGIKDEILPIERVERSYRNLDYGRHKIIRITEPELGHTINDFILYETKKFLRIVFKYDVVQYDEDL